MVSNYKLIIFILLTLSVKCFGQFHAVYISDEKLTQIKIDGDIRDWNWVPERYWITPRSMTDLEHIDRPNEKDYWKGKFFVGWNEHKNWIYIIADIYDDYLNTTNLISPIAYKNDCIAISINPDNEGGDFVNANSNCINNVFKRHFIIRALENKNPLETDSTSHWLPYFPEYFVWDRKINMGKSNSYNVSFELGVSMWDSWNMGQPNLSIRSRLHTFQLIRLIISFIDVDKVLEKRVTLLSTSPYIESWRNARLFSQFILDSPLEDKNITYDKIDLILKP